MSIQIKLNISLRGVAVSQILLIGNGLEYKSGQRSWGALVDDLTIPGRRDTQEPMSYRFHRDTNYFLRLGCT